MRNFTFEMVVRDSQQDNLYDIFRQTIVDKKIENKYYNFVKTGEECRLDKVSLRLSNSTAYIEEIMLLNNIVNPWSVNLGDEITFLDTFVVLQEVEEEDTDIKNIVNPSKNKDTRIDPNRQKGTPPTIKPTNFKQILVDKKNQTIKLNTKLS